MVARGQLGTWSLTILGALVGAGLMLALERGVATAADTPKANQTIALPGGKLDYRYSAGQLVELSPIRGERILEVVPFPEHPAFLIRTGSNIDLYERRGAEANKLLSIGLDGSFDSIHFLADQRTFVVQTSKSVRVFTLDRNVVMPTPVTRR